MNERAKEREESPDREERAAAISEGSVERRDSPRKRHGDALEDGSGNRHGVHEVPDEEGARE